MPRLSNWFFILIFSLGFYTSFTPEAKAQPEVRSIDELTSNWSDENGKTIQLAQFKGKPLFLTMAYTSCKMSCPTMVRTLKKVSQDLAKKNIHPNFVIITFDPKTDTSKRLSSFKHQWELPEETWHFLTGNTSDTESVRKFLDFKIVYDKIDNHYTHDKKIFIFNKEGKMIKTFEDWDSDFSTVLTENELKGNST